jgi:hypothetical protein
MLSLKSHVKLKPVALSNIISAGKLRSRHPAFELKPKLSAITRVNSSVKTYVHTFFFFSFLNVLYILNILFLLWAALVVSEYLGALCFFFYKIFITYQKKYILNVLDSRVH